MKINLTLDYELFMNELTGNVENCLIRPTDEFLNLTRKYGIKVMFFVDASYLYRLNELKNSYPRLGKDLESIKKQIHDIEHDGHAIGLHLHPQWYFSTFDGEQWAIDFDHYKLSDMPREMADTYFKESLRMLQSYCNQQIKTFRGGGYSVQGYKSFPEILCRNGIVSDSSALFGMNNLSKLHYYDYTALESPEPYMFSTDILQPDTAKSTQSIREYPIMTAKIPFLIYCFNKFRMRYIKNNRNWGDGGVKSQKRRRMFLHNLRRKADVTVRVPATIDYQSFVYLSYIVRKSMKQYSEMTIIGHPKNFSPASLAALERIMRRHRESFKLLNEQ